MMSNLPILAVDGLLFLLFVVVFPIVGFYGYRRQLRLAETGQGMTRVQMYRHTILVQWSMAALLLLVWVIFKRDVALLGVPHNPTGYYTIAVILAVVGVGFFAAQLLSLRKAGPETLTRIREQMGDVSLLVPQTRNDLHWFYGLSFTAGVVEELIWRGYLILILSQWMPITWAAAISIVVFSIAHAYQGLSQIPGVALIALLLTLIFVFSGSIWLPILVHIAIDAIQGRTSFEVAERLKTLPPEEELSTAT